MKKMMSVWLVVMLLLAAFPATAETYAMLQTNVTARVEEVVDGDSMLARQSNGQAVLIKLIGVDTMGGIEAYEFLRDKVQGQQIQFVLDANMPGDGRWNYAYAYQGDELINGTILQNGLGKLNASHERATLYKALSARQNAARMARAGIWANAQNVSDAPVASAQININTATSAQLRARLEGVDSTVAKAIVEYRDKNPFDAVDEIKFVKGFTKEMYDKNRNNMVVVTNMHTATRADIALLKSLVSEDVRHIVEYRDRYGFDNLTNLTTYNCMTQEQYDDNLPYMSLGDVLRLEEEEALAEPLYTVNVNTAAVPQFVSAGLTEAQAEKLVAMRNKYTFKSLYDLNDALGLSEDEINLLADNLNLHTEINRASEFEIRTLFNPLPNAQMLGKKVYDKKTFAKLGDVQALLTRAEYAKIAPYIFIAVPAETRYVNANTATVEQMVAVGIPRSYAVQLQAQAGKMTGPDKIPAGALTHERHFTLHTNINTASYAELASLHPEMPVSLINAILDYRNSQPFGSQGEIAQLFKAQKQTAIYEQCKTFLVTR